MKKTLTYIHLPFIFLLSLVACAKDDQPASEAIHELIKVLYVTHEPGQWHDYVGQRQAFEEIATNQDWKTTILSFSYDDLITELAKGNDFAKGYDVVVYNFCLAKSANLKAVANIIRQTNELNINTLLIHGSMHSFWPTFTKKGKKNNQTFMPVGCSHGQTDAKLIEEWKKQNPGQEFPVWGDFCGLASDKHTRKEPINIHKLIEHEAAQSVTQDYITEKTELYLTLYKTRNIIEILEGSSLNTKLVAPILWEQPYNEATVMGFSLGHFTSEWKTPEFQAILIDSIEYLARAKTKSN